MIGFIILTSTLSLLIIILIHTMFNYFVNVFTNESVKDPIHISSIQETFMTNINKDIPAHANTTNNNLIINPSEYIEVV
jgi:hypothetical protein